MAGDSGGGYRKFSLGRDDADTLPEAPGVYLFTGEGGRIIYVGKAGSLRKRVKSYFTGSEPANPRLAQLRAGVRGIDYIITANQAEALLLESTLIKQHRPDYNIMLMDDKSYPYIGITVSEEYPRAFFFRGERRRDTVYYGPFWHAGSARETLEALRKVFPFRTCPGPRPGRRRGSPCLDYHINLCPGPCRGGVDPEEYAASIASVREFLGGRQDRVLSDLRAKMKGEAERQEFEKAARTRDALQALERILERQTVYSMRDVDQDVFGLTADELDACVTVLFVRSGLLTGKREFVFSRPPEAEMESVLESFLEQYYETAPYVPAEVLTPLDLGEERAGLLAGWLGDRRERKVRVTCPQRGRKRDLVRKAGENASSYLEMVKLKRASDLKWLSEVTSTLMRDLLLQRLPYRIECYDISNLGAEEVVGAMVVFEGGLPLRRDYRKFLIRSGGADDTARMSEVLERRLRRLVTPPPGSAGGEGGPAASRLTSFAKAPDLILIDGGRGQLNAAVRALEERGLEEVEVASLAKRLECVFRPGLSQPIILPADSRSLYLLQRIRDEAHRFAINYHRSLRESKARGSALDGIAGIGKTRKARLMERYGSVARMAGVTREEFASLPFMDRRSSDNLYEALHGGE